MAILRICKPPSTWVGWYILPFVMVMTAIVFFHELGHYIVGRWCGVKIDAFSLGFGPELCSRVDKRGTRWRIAAFPLGGYVKFHGDANAASAPDHERRWRRWPRRSARATFAGAAARQSRRDRRGRSVRQFHSGHGDLSPRSSSSSAAPNRRRASARSKPGSPAALGGLPGRRLVKAINGGQIATFEDLQQATRAQHRPADELRRRSGGRRDATLPPRRRLRVVDQGPLGKRRIGHLGLGSTRNPADVQDRSLRLAGLLAYGARRQVGFIVEATGAYVGGLIAGRETADQLSGPIGIAQIAGEMAKISLWQLLNLAATVLGLGRPDESAAGAAARRRPPAVLRVRGAARPARSASGCSRSASESASPWSQRW